MPLGLATKFSDILLLTVSFICGLAVPVLLATLSHPSRLHLGPLPGCHDYSWIMDPGSDHLRASMDLTTIHSSTLCFISRAPILARHCEHPFLPPLCLVALR